MKQHTTQQTLSTVHTKTPAPAEASILVAGLGGMGVIGLTRSVAGALGRRYARVYTKESRGFAQRGACVLGTVRAGLRVRSPELVAGAGLVLALEASEAVRHEQFVRPGTLVVAGDTCIWPNGFSGSDFTPMAPEFITARMRTRGAEVMHLPICKLLRERGVPQLFGSSVMLGAFAALEGLDMDEVEQRVAGNWRESDRRDNLEVCRLGHAHIMAQTDMHKVLAKAA